MYLTLKHRSQQKEILDDFNLKGHDLSRNLRELQKVNTLLGGYNIVKEGVIKICQKCHIKQPMHIVDVGCGGGDTLRMLARWGKAQKLNLRLSGIDANENAIAFARQASKAFPQIDFRHLNIFSPEFRTMEYDIVMFNLFIHHFEEEKIIAFLKVCKEKKATILINDLHRSVIAYYLFRLASKMFNFSRISRHDGLLSIRKGFSKKDWKQLLAQAGIEDYEIKWRWAFRHQVIIW